jgi:hypothetical protein
MTVRLIGHEESFEVRYSDGRPSKYFYFDEHPGRRAITKRWPPGGPEVFQSSEAPP